MKPFFVLFAALGGVSLSASASAQSWPDLSSPPAVERSGAGDVAVVVAIEDYAFLPDVPGATRNAADWEAFLKDGLGVEQVLLLTNQQAVREEILAFAERGAQNATAGGTLWFVFIGHGGPDERGSDGLLIGADGQQNARSMTTRGLPQSELIETLEKGKQARTVVLIDACFSGRDSAGAALAKGTMPVIAVDAAPEVASTTVVLTAARADEFAGDLPGANRPAFSYLVLGAIRGWANNGDGEVTADEAVALARRELLGISGRQQTPTLTGNKRVVLTRGATEARPGMTAAPTADPAPVGTVDARSTIAPAESTDGVPDSPFYGFVEGGYGILKDSGPVAMAGVGVKINGFTGSLSEWRVGVRGGLALTANPVVPEVGETYDDGTAVDGADKIPGGQMVPYVVGVEVGRAWRKETGPGLFGDQVFGVSAMGLYGAAKQCVAWSVDTSSGSRKIVCNEESSRSGPGAAVEVGAQTGILRVGAALGFVADLGLMTNLTVGLTWDR